MARELGRRHRHRLLDHHMNAALHRRDRMGGVQAVRRGDHQRVHGRFVQHAHEIFGTVGDVEGGLHPGEFVPAETARRDELHIGPALQDRQMVGDRPPACAHHAHSQSVRHALPPVPNAADACDATAVSLSEIAAPGPPRQASTRTQTDRRRRCVARNARPAQPTRTRRRRPWAEGGRRPPRAAPLDEPMVERRAPGFAPCRSQPS